MADTSRLKKKAAEFESKRQYDRAIAVYEEIVQQTSGEPREADVPVFNRLGDLYLRAGSADRAVALYEKAVDHYAELGFFNNAIALCNKILRQSPNRSSVYYKLGKISARKGFVSDAKQNFLEYAARMQRAGKLDEAFRALKEFADLCPGQDEVRLMLAEQLTRVGRKTEALEQLQALHEQLDAEGRAAEAAAAAERMRTLNPDVEPRRASGSVERSGDDLVFLDLSDQGAEAEGAQPLEGLEPTSLTEPPSVTMPLRPLTPQEFSAVQLPPPAEEAAPAADDAPEAAAEPVAEVAGPVDPARALADLPLLDTGLPGDEASQPPIGSVPAPEAEEPRVTPVEGFEPTAAEPEAAGSAPLPRPAAPSVARTSPAAGSSSNIRAAPPPPTAEGDLVDLGEWLRADQEPRSMRMITDAEEPPEGEQADFAEMLDKFKQGLAQHMDEEDYASHYDLAIAFREMGLVDEAIAEFQKALRGPEHRVAIYESLGQCFVEKGQHEIVHSLLQRALREPDFEDDQGLGVLYLLGVAAEALGRQAEAAGYYQRVLAVDIRFRDVTDRLAAVTGAAR